MITLLILLLMAGCAKTEVINTPQMQGIDTLVRETKAHKEFTAKRDTAKIDTTKVPIGWNATVKDWDNGYRSEQNL